MIQKNIDYKVVKYMSVSVDNMLECVTVELCFSENKSYLITCVYRKCGSDIALFNNQSVDIICKGKNRKKKHYICGDFNIDLLKYDVNVHTTTFVDTMYS